MKVIDAHLHLDDKMDGTVETAATKLSQDLSTAGIEWGLVLHLLAQPWSKEEVAYEIAKHSNLKAFVNVDPRDSDCKTHLKDAFNKLNFIGLKLHPRLQGFLPDDPEVIRLCQMTGDLGKPVLIDAFPDGTALMNGFNPLHYATLAQKCPQTRFIWAHMGAHYVLDFMLLAKRLSNVYLDCSYSLLYFRGSTVPQNMVYAMRSMRFQRIFYGSDYPDRSIEETLRLSKQILLENNLNQEQMNQILYLNADHFFSV